MAFSNITEYVFSKKQNMEMLLSFSPKNRATETIPSFLLGYQLFNLLGLEIKNSLPHTKTEQVKNISNNANDVGYYLLQEIQKEHKTDPVRFFSDVLFIKAFFEAVDYQNANIDDFLYYLQNRNLRIPCYTSRQLTDFSPYEKEIITKDDYSFYLNNTKQLLSKQSAFFDQNEVVIYFCYNTLDLLVAATHFMLSNGYAIKICKVCNKPFLAYNRSDTVYCDRTAPGGGEKTCKEYGAIKAHQDNLKNDEAKGLYRKIYMQKQMLAKRYPDLINYTNEFREFRDMSKQWQLDIKAGNKSHSDYLAWLRSFRRKGGEK